ncbi:MAG TPA: PHP domain-containing protein [Candidatus Brocadiia bacterium]|nr:PHP domain-containing protein [Candidatus Brocadiia bacterium]
MIADLHVHTSHSGCARRDWTPETVVRSAIESGLDAIGVTDHLWSPDAFDALFEVAVRTREIGQREGLTVFLGAEVETFGVEGDLAILPEQAARLDYVLAASGHLHLDHVRKPPGRTKGDLIDFIHRMNQNLCLNPLVNAVAHPWQAGSARYERFGFPPTAAEDYPLDMLAELGETAARTGTAIELNCSGVNRIEGQSLPACAGGVLRLAEGLAPTQALFTLGSDTHGPSGLCRVPMMMELLPHIGIEPGRLTVPGKRGG